MIGTAVIDTALIDTAMIDTDGRQQYDSKGRNA
jgi:enolase